MGWEASGPTFFFFRSYEAICVKQQNSALILAMSIYRWISRTIDLESINYTRYPKRMEDLLTFDSSMQSYFNFQMALNIEAINNETSSIHIKDR